MSALLWAVGLAALIIAGIITGALQLLHQGNAGQLLPMLDASGNSLHQHLLSMIIAGIITGALRLVHQGNAGQLLP